MMWIESVQPVDNYNTVILRRIFSTNPQV